MNTSVNKLGFWSAMSSTGFALGYSIAQLLSTFQVIPHPQDLFWLFLPSLFLAPAFLVTMICLNYSAPESTKIWTNIGLAFAGVYCTFATLVYFTQLTVVLPAQYQGLLDKSNLLLFDEKTFLYAVDCLGYFFMSLSTLFAAFAFNTAKYKWLYRGLQWNGALLPILILAFFYPVLIYGGALWMITFPMAMINSAIFFRMYKRVRINLEYESRCRKVPAEKIEEEVLINY